MASTDIDTINIVLKRIENVSADELVCPITFERFHDPVIAGDGHIYERAEIIRWIREKGTSPLTREPLHLKDIRRDEAVCEAITHHYASKPFNLRKPLLLLSSQERRRQRRLRRTSNPTSDINHELSRISTIEQNIPLPTPIVPNHRFLPIQSYNPIPRRLIRWHYSNSSSSS
ncbi:unnamed protein product [Rotaria sordida]|uniref:U-box domain-containing protein n=1 Tax=Rotaria sordida TaxID=392033 RepID=A0A815XPL8_9BILA|nr:unnamed protein product [Rotaria sordida]